MILTLALAFSLAHASTEATDLFEKTFPRDNTFCYQNGKRVEILIRGETKFIEPSERGFGEFFFMRVGTDLTLLPLNSSRSDSLKFFRGAGTVCSKGMSFKVDKETAGVLFLKENKPFKEKLVVQFFDFTNLKPKDFIETIYTTDKVELTKTGFAFNSLDERIDSEMGKVTIAGLSYTYQDREFPKWMGYSSKGFEILGSLTFKRLPWKSFFKDEADFFQSTGWNPNKKEFANVVVYVAVNHTEKKTCLLLVPEKKKPTGDENWRCHTI